MKNILRFLIVLEGLQCVAFGNSLSSFIRPGAGNIPVHVTNGECYAEDFGVIPDDGIDDTAAMQRGLDWAGAKTLDLILPNGLILTNDTLYGLFRPGWALKGQGGRATEVRSSAVNKPMLSIGDRIQGSHTPTESPGAPITVRGPGVSLAAPGELADNATGCYGIEVSGINFTYTTQHTWLQTSANMLRFSGPFTDSGTPGWVQVSDSVFKDLVFGKGYYAVWSDPTKGWEPWGCYFDRIQLGDLTGGFFYLTGTGVAGPNNIFGLIYGRGDRCVWNTTGTPQVAPGLFVVKGYNTTITNYEVNWNGHSNGGSGSINAASFILNGQNFSSALEGKGIIVRGAGAAGADLYTTVATPSGSTYPNSCTLTVAASTSVSGASYGFTGPPELHLIAGSTITASAFKTENFVKTSDTPMFSMETNSRLSIEQVTGGGSREIDVSGSAYVFRAYGGGQIKGLTIGHLDFSATKLAAPLTGGGTLYLFDGVSGSGRIHVTGQIDLNTGVKFSNVGGNKTVANSVVVDSYSNGLMSLDKGDVDYTFTLGDPTTVTDSTPFTADRSRNLPTVNNLNPGGLKITYRREASATGVGNELIKDNGVVVASLPNPDSSVTLEWRMMGTAASGGGWRVISRSPAPTPTLTTAQLLALTAAQSTDYDIAFCSDCLTFANTSPTPVYFDGTVWRLTGSAAAVTTDLLVLARSASAANTPSMSNSVGGLRWLLRPATIGSEQQINSGANAGFDQDVASNGQERVSMGTGTTATGYCYTGHPNNKKTSLGSTGQLARKAYKSCRFYLANASNATDGYYASFGFFSSYWTYVPVSGASAAVFVVDERNTQGLGNTGNSTNYICVVRVGSVSYPLITSVAPSLIDTAPDLLEILSIAGVGIYFYINGNLVHSDTTHLLGSGTVLMEAQAIVKTVGANSRSTFFFDKREFSQHF